MSKVSQWYHHATTLLLLLLLLQLVEHSSGYSICPSTGSGRVGSCCTTISQHVKRVTESQQSQSESPPPSLLLLRDERDSSSCSTQTTTITTTTASPMIVPTPISMGSRLQPRDHNRRDHDRRIFLQNLGIVGTTFYTNGAQSLAVAAEYASTLKPLQYDNNNNNNNNMDNPDYYHPHDDDYSRILNDLPPKAPNTIRLYLCRHGQTENNRLHIVQGSRVNPPLNSNGIQMAERLGIALSGILSFLPLAVANESNSDMPWMSASSTLSSSKEAQNSTSHHPHIIIPIYHSPLLRAQQTAQIVSTQIMKAASIAAASNHYICTNTLLQVRDDLKEFDFGPLRDGTPEGGDQSKKPSLSSSFPLYKAWSMGQIDERPEGGGESGREMLLRSASFLSSVITQARTATNSQDAPQDSSTSYWSDHVIAVTHSAYIRILLALVQGTGHPYNNTTMSLLQAMTMTKQMNANINVLDLHMNDTMENQQHTSKPITFLVGRENTGPQDFSLRLPTTKVVRINEIRHLNGVPTS